VIAVASICDVPLVTMATRWFRGIHPVAPELDPRMRLVLVCCIVCFTTLFAALILYRRRQLEWTELIAQIEAGG
jgi:heme exporter protein C